MFPLCFKHLPVVHHRVLLPQPLPLLPYENIMTAGLTNGFWFLFFCILFRVLLQRLQSRRIAFKLQPQPHWQVMHQDWLSMWCNHEALVVFLWTITSHGGQNWAVFSWDHQSGVRCLCLSALELQAEEPVLICTREAAHMVADWQNQRFHLWSCLPCTGLYVSPRLGYWGWCFHLNQRGLRALSAPWNYISVFYTVDRLLDKIKLIYFNCEMLIWFIAVYIFNISWK